MLSATAFVCMYIPFPYGFLHFFITWAQEWWPQLLTWTSLTWLEKKGQYRATPKLVKNFPLASLNCFFYEHKQSNLHSSLHLPLLMISTLVTKADLAFASNDMFVPGLLDVLLFILAVQASARGPVYDFISIADHLGLFCPKSYFLAFSFSHQKKK